MKPCRIMPDPKFGARCKSRTGNLHHVGQMELKANELAGMAEQGFTIALLCGSSEAAS
jgi:hypothetical protein